MAVQPNDPIDVALGARMRIIRLMRGFSQQHLAQAAGVTFQQIQKYERGGNRVSASMLTRIASCLGVPVSELFGESSIDLSALDQVADVLGQPGALDLLAAYVALPAQADRAALVELLHSAVS